MKDNNSSNTRHFLLLIAIAISLNTCSLYLFVRGFLPLKTTTFRYATFNDVHSYSSDLHYGISDQRQIYKPSIDRLVLIVIDAFRADFVPSVKPGFFNQTTMPYVENLIQSGKALKFISKCHSPTVTLPRIKSILTGTIPSFADLIFNLNAASLNQDSFIAQAASQNKKMVFYGDDTWIKLFPNHFSRQDGTTSFFVSDYTEVDQNVSRHIDEELKLMDWDIMILHYLGVDHIGHLAGPASLLLPPKLLEMDDIIKKVHKSLFSTKRKTTLPDLIVVTGDHGMSISGNHGGVSPGEVSTPLIMLSTNTDQTFDMQLKEVLQIDLAPTLSVMLGLPIPANNYGCLVKEVMNMTKVPVEQQLFNFHYNGIQLSELKNDAEVNLNNIMAEGVKYHNNWLSLKTKGIFTSDTTLLAQQTMDKYANYTETMSKTLISSAEKYDTSAMIIAIIISWQVVIFLFSYLTTLPENKPSVFNQANFSSFELITLVLFSASILTYLYINSNSLILHSIWTALTGTIMIICSNALFIKSLNILKNTSLIASIMSSQTNIFLVFGTGLYVISLLSSSFIEEEHEIWYFLTSSYYLLSLYCLEISDKTSNVPKCTCQGFSYTLEKSSEQILPILANSATVHNEQKKVLESSAIFSNAKFISGLGLIVVSRVLRSWNQTGNKWAHLPDIGDFLNLPANKFVLTAAVVGAVVFIILLVAYDREALQSGCLAICILCIYFYRVSTKQLIFFMDIEEFDGTLAMKAFYVCLTAIVILRLCIYYCKLYHKLLFDYTVVIDKFNLLRYLIQCWIIFAAALHRPHNIPLLAGVILQEYLVSKILENKSTETLAIVYSWMGMCSFFYQGNSNSLSTIDVSAGYLGLSSYHPIFVGILIACNTYSGMLFWLLMLMFRILGRVILLKCDCSIEQMTIHVKKCVCAILCMRYLSCALYLVVMVILRYHLFIWTVFTPKLLYEGAHNIVFSLYVIFALLFSANAKH